MEGEGGRDGGRERDWYSSSQECRGTTVPVAIRNKGRLYVNEQGGAFGIGIFQSRKDNLLIDLDVFKSNLMGTVINQVSSFVMNNLKLGAVPVQSLHAVNPIISRTSKKKNTSSIHVMPL